MIESLKELGKAILVGCGLSVQILQRFKRACKRHILVIMPVGIILFLGCAIYWLMPAASQHNNNPVDNVIDFSYKGDAPESIILLAFLRVHDGTRFAYADQACYVSSGRNVRNDTILVHFPKGTKNDAIPAWYAINDWYDTVNIDDNTKAVVLSTVNNSLGQYTLSFPDSSKLFCESRQ